MKHVIVIFNLEYSADKSYIIICNSNYPKVNCNAACLKPKKLGECDRLFYL